MKVREYFKKFYQRNGAGLATFLLVAVGFWMFFMIILPQLGMLDYSLRPRLAPADVGGPQDVYTLEHYRHLVRGSTRESEPLDWGALSAKSFAEMKEELCQRLNCLDMGVFLRTLFAAVFVTLFDLALCYPIAYYLAQSARGGWARLMVVSLIVPFWVNEILRAFAFKIMFGSTGVINTFLIWMGFIELPIDFIRLNIALYSGLGYAFILLMIFPLYNAIESLDKNQIEAARDMGASWIRIHWRVVIPYAKPGISSGCTMVFMLTAGALAAPQILGGPSSLWFTQLVYQWFTTGNNWNRGSAYALVLLISTILLVMLAMKIFKIKLGEIAR